jgi:hypothetical protein
MDNEDGNFFKVTYADGHTTVVVEISAVEALTTASLTGTVAKVERTKRLW